ncbi:MAG: ATP-binding protein [Crocinitomicaceae bacterium]
MDILNLEGIYHVLFDSVGEGLIIVNSKGAIVMANPRSCNLFGYTKEEMATLKVEDLIPQSLREKHVHHREEYHEHPRKRRMGRNMNLKALKKDGNEFDVEISLNHFQANGDAYVVAVITDVTERVIQQTQIQELNANLERKVEERTQQVLESQKLYSTIAKNFPNGTINVFDRDLKYIFLEGLELQELGVNKERLIGTSYLDKIAKDVRPTIERELNKVFKGESKDFELKHLDQIYRINAVPLSDDKDRIDKILVVEENITEQKLIEQQQEAALQKERQLNEMKSRFVSMASHEFRTPLSTVLSSVSLIEKYIEKEEIDKTEKHIKRVKSAVAGLTEILNDFLSVEKLESNKSVVNLQEFDYRQFSEDMVEEMRTICLPGQKINSSLEATHTSIRTDQKILKNVLYNLLSNAIKYSKENQEIIYHSEITDTQLKITIKDNGIGIPKEEQGDLFERFFRAKNVTNIKGTGLGLNIVKKYVEMLEGEIHFESELNEGTTFFLNLPLTNL